MKIFELPILMKIRDEIFFLDSYQLQFVEFCMTGLSSDAGLSFIQLLMLPILYFCTWAWRSCDALELDARVMHLNLTFVHLMLCTWAWRSCDALELDVRAFDVMHLSLTLVRCTWTWRSCMGVVLVWLSQCVEYVKVTRSIKPKY